MVFVAALGTCISPMSNTSSVSSDTTQTGFLTSSSICFRQTALYLHTLLRFIGSLFELESQKKRSRKSPLNVMRISERTLLLAWRSIHPNNLGFSMRFRKTSALPLGPVDDLV